MACTAKVWAETVAGLSGRRARNSTRATRSASGRLKRGDGRSPDAARFTPRQPDANEESEPNGVAKSAGSSTPDLSAQNFSADANGADPSSWYDTGANNSLAHDESKFKVFSVAGNNVFGTTFSSSDNVHSHYIGGGSDQWKDYRYSGRMMTVSANNAIGVTVMSDYPTSDSYYRLRRLANGSFHIATHGSSIECTGDTETGYDE